MSLSWLPITNKESASVVILCSFSLVRALNCLNACLRCCSNFCNLSMASCSWWLCALSPYAAVRRVGESWFGEVPVGVVGRGGCRIVVGACACAFCKTVSCRTSSRLWSGKGVGSAGCSGKKGCSKSSFSPACKLDSQSIFAELKSMHACGSCSSMALVHLLMVLRLCWM